MYAINDSSVTSTSVNTRRRVSTVEAVGARAVMALSCAYYVVGTMGLLTPESIEQRSATSIWGLNYNHPSRSAHSVKDLEATIAPTPAEDIARIRAVLKPAVLELANLFGVSRQAVYDWQGGAQPSPQVAEKLSALARAAHVFETSGVAVNSQTLRRRVAGGSTLLDAVMNGADAVQVAELFVQTLKREGSQQQQLSRRFAGRTTIPIAADEYGAPQLSDLT